jgi:hypothetical protein
MIFSFGKNKIIATFCFILLLSSCSLFRKTQPVNPVHSEKEYIVSWDDSEYNYNHELENNLIDTSRIAIDIPVDDFYRKYSEILGVTFSGNENKALLTEIAEWLDTKYSYGISVKQKGSDCSGFVQNIYRDIYQIELPHSSSAQSEMAELIEKQDLKEGDMVFFKIKGGRVSHVGLYLKDGYFIHASVKAGVIVSNLSEDYYQRYFYMGGRIKPELGNRRQ